MVYTNLSNGHHSNGCVVDYSIQSISLRVSSGVSLVTYYLSSECCIKSNDWPVVPWPVKIKCLVWPSPQFSQN